MRFIAAFSVVVCHNSFYTHERLNDSFGIYTQGARGVALFFVISGFVMVISTSRAGQVTYDWRRFVLRRLARIVPLYWFATSVKVLTIILAASLVLHAQFDLGNIIKSYFFIPSRNPGGEIQPLLGVGWTLVYELFFYLLFALALFLRRDPFVFTTLIMFSLSVIGLFRTPAWPDLAYFLVDSIVLDFVMGMIIAKIVLSKKQFSPLLMAGLMLAGLFLLFQPFGLLNFILDNSPLGAITNFVVGVISFFVIWGAVELEDRYGQYVPSMILFLGAGSYSLYLMHPMIGPIVPAFLAKFAPFAQQGSFWFIASALAGILASLVAGAVVYLLFEVPVTDRLNGRIKTYLEQRKSKTLEQRQSKIVQ